MWIGPENRAADACRRTVETVYNREKGYQYVFLRWKNLPSELKALKGRAQAQKADIIRMWLLFHFGGVWADTDIIARKEIPFRDTLKEFPFTVITNNHSNGLRASNSLLACNAGNPIMKTALEQGMAAFSRHGVLTWTACGPDILTWILKENREVWHSLDWEKWAHDYTNNTLQKLYRADYAPERDDTSIYDGNWTYAHVLGKCLQTHRNTVSFKNGKSVFCAILHHVYDLLGLELQ